MISQKIYVTPYLCQVFYLKLWKDLQESLSFVWKWIGSIRLSHPRYATAAIVSVHVVLPYDPNGLRVMWHDISPTLRHFILCRFNFTMHLILPGVRRIRNYHKFMWERFACFSPAPNQKFYVCLFWVERSRFDVCYGWSGRFCRNCVDPGNFLS